MPVKLRRLVPSARLVLPATLVLLIAVAAAQQSGNNLGDVGLQILQGLSPEQRDALSQQMGSGGLGGLLGGQSVSGRQRQGEQEQQQADRERAQRAQMEKLRAEQDRLSPFLKGEDWIVITIDSNPLPAIPTAPPASGALEALGTQMQTPQQGGTQNPPAISPSPVPGVPVLSNTPAATGAALGAAAAAAQSAPSNTTAGGYATRLPNESGQMVPGSRAQEAAELTDEEKKMRAALIDLIRSKNPYQLSRDGLLSLPGFAPIPLAGLTEQLATLRLGVEPALRNLYIRVTKLPLTKTGPTALKPFGYELFNEPVSTFAPSTNVPVPADYVVGPGDELEVQLYGSKNATLKLTVGRDGRVSFPELGPISVGGQTFNSVKNGIEARVARQLIGAHASVTMGDTRSIRVFVLGDAKQPGSYTISGLGTISSALFAAGGVLPIGSLRDIQLKRQGAVVRKLDLYDMLIRGNTTDDANLLPGDVIFVPPIGPTVSVDGEVRRPAIYEVRNERSVGDVVQLAGGLTPEADTTRVAVTRINAQLRRVVLQVNLNATSSKSEPVRDGDSLRVPRLRPTLDAGVQVQGYLYSTGSFAYHEGMRLSDVIHSVDDLKPNADLHYILIRRELPPDNRVTVLSADLEAAMRAPGSAADVPLMARDRITVFDLQSSRDRVIQPLLDDLKLQSNIGRPDEVVRIEGRANVPGEYPFEQGMRVGDLIRAGGGLSDGAYGGTAELTRYRVINGESRRTELIQINLAAALQGNQSDNVPLEPFDTLSIKQVESWTDQEEVTLRGEVRFPGKYSIKRGETLKSVVLRAGGLTDYAFADGSVFTRRDLREREQKQLDLLAARMQNDITFVALQGAAANQGNAASALTVGQSLLAQLRQSRAVGRLVINLARLMRSPPGSPSDVILRDGDELYVPKFQQEVTVIGEVQTVTSHLYRPGLSQSDYIAMSGGETVRADNSRIYIVRADGSVVGRQGNRWFHTTSVHINPGDTIVVPLNAEHMPPLPLWQAVTQIIYNVAIAAAAVHSF